MININVNEEITLEFEIQNLNIIKNVFFSIINEKTGNAFDGKIDYESKTVIVDIPILSGLVDTGLVFKSYLEVHTHDNHLVRTCEDDLTFVQGNDVAEIEIVEKKDSQLKADLVSRTAKVQLNSSNIELRPVSKTPR